MARGSFFTKEIIKMADRDFSTVQFAMEKKVVMLSARITFGANGVPTLDAVNSKGFAACTQYSTTFTATGTATASITGASNFTGLYNGMILSGTNVAAGSVISAINAPAGTFTLSTPTTGAIGTVTATGGYQLQLGKTLQNGISLDPYRKILGVDLIPDMSGLQGAAAVQAGAPNWYDYFLIGNTISSATAVTGASLYFQLGYATGSGAANWKTVNPASGEALFIRLKLCNSTAA